MILLFKSRDNTLADVQWFRDNCGKKVGPRVSVSLKQETGLKQVNEMNHEPVQLNVIYNRPPGELRGYIPKGITEFTEYKSRLRRMEDLLEVKPQIIVVENETYIAPNMNPDMKMVSNMIHYNYELFTPQGIKVSTSGATMYLGAALVKKYLTDRGETQRFKEFDDKWVYFFADDLVAPALAELRLITDLPDVMYALHMNIGRDNIGCIELIVEAVRHYIGAHKLFINELSFHPAGQPADATLVDDTMSILKKIRVPVVGGYEGDGNGAAAWTDEMKQVFAQYSN